MLSRLCYFMQCWRSHGPMPQSSHLPPQRMAALHTANSQHPHRDCSYKCGRDPPPLITWEGHSRARGCTSNYLKSVCDVTNGIFTVRVLSCRPQIRLIVSNVPLIGPEVAISHVQLPFGIGRRRRHANLMEGPGPFARRRPTKNVTRPKLFQMPT